ncbi:CABYR protein, partial [Aegotheles bennettii]|nr:CABYR protein [Aegotheles bennettii]
VTPPGLEILLEGMTRAALEKNPDNMIEFFAFYFQELITFRKDNGDEGLGEKTLQHADILLSGEHMRSDKCTDTEEDQLLQELDIQYSSKETQCPSVASSLAESKSRPGSDGASCPASPELVYPPAEPAQLAAHVLGSWCSLYSMRDVATSVQTLHEDSQTSEEEFTPAEDAAEGASAVPAAEASVETLGSQPGVRSQSPIAGELGPSGSQADASTTDVLQASSAPLWEEPPPSSLLPPPPSPTRKDSLEAVPSCNEGEVPSATEVVSQCWDAGLILDSEVP